MNLNCRACRTPIPRKRRGDHKQATSFMIILTMCLSGRSLSNLHVRPRCQTVSYAAVRLANTTPAFFSASKKSSMLCDLIYGGLSASKSSLFLWEQGVNYCFDAIVDQLFEDLVKDAEQRIGAVAVWVLYRF